MGILQDIYNWLAMRNLGEMLGMEWDPKMDVRHQRQRFKERVDGTLEWLRLAEGLLEKGDTKRAGDIAYGVFRDFPYAILPEILKAYRVADEIIAKLPRDYVPQKPEGSILFTRMAADQAAARLAEATRLADQGEHVKAYGVVDEILNHAIFAHGGVRAMDVKFKAMDLEDVLRAKIKRTSPGT